MASIYPYENGEEKEDVTTYLLRDDMNGKITISKWEGGVVPTQVYRVQLNEGRKNECNCPSGSYRGYCKHLDMARGWVKLGKPEGMEFGG